MKVLLLGSGGREHALAWKMAQSSKLTKLYIAPGNAGTQEAGENVNISVGDFDAIADFIVSKQIELVIVGPEDPLVKGIKDFLKSNEVTSQVPVIGPNQEAAQLEGSKKYAKEFMFRHDIPTAGYISVTKDNVAEGHAFLSSTHAPYVLKADGLAAGKGVLILDSKEEAIKELDNMFNGKFGAAGATVVIEEFLSGIELSVFVLTDGTSYKVLPEAKDYKRIGEGDTGLNTGGMGAISPVPFADDAFMQKVEQRIIKPTIEGFKKDALDYTGFVFIGLMNMNGDPYVIEYNVRLGDPEAEVVLPRIQDDLLLTFEEIGKGILNQKPFKLHNGSTTTVIMVSGGYPESYEKGKVINGLDKVEGSIVFHAGTKDENGSILTDGGRVLAITSQSETMEGALEKSFNNAAKISYDKKYYRSDIGFDLK